MTTASTRPSQNLGGRCWVASSGIELFRETMTGFEGCYVLIGGSACELLLEQQGERFRATKDLDIVILADNADDAFSESFWSFVRGGGYEPWCSKDERLHFYRFVNPKAPGYPHMIELFSRHPDFALTDEDVDIAPLPLAEDISSLSAIMLDDDYYGLLTDGLTVVNGISTLDEAHLIILKMRAHIDLNDRANSGQHVNGADLKKHRKDVMRLLEFVPAGLTLELPAKVKEDARRFIDTIEDPSFRIDQLNISLDRESAITALRRLCGI